jgi:aspartate dehydrogenase
LGADREIIRMGVAMSQARKRIGLIGFGFIGEQVYRRITSQPELGLDIAFVHNRSAGRVAELPRELMLDDLDAMRKRNADVVVEMAHPDYTRQWGERILEHSTYLPLSVAALADDVLLERLQRSAHRHGTRLAVPHGALMGLDSLREWRHVWTELEIAFYKSPANIDFSESGIDPQTITSERTLYQGPVRGIARLFPRNVNTMVTCALATIGLDRCQARLVAVPGLGVAIAEVNATGADGSRLVMRKEQPVSGVSGTEMFESQFASIMRASGTVQALEFV